MTPAELLTGARAVLGVLPLPEPAHFFVTTLLGIGDALLGVGPELHRAAKLVHEVVESFRRADAAGRDAMHAHWQARAAEALRRDYRIDAAAEAPEPPETEPGGFPYEPETGR